MNVENINAAPGPSERILREIMATPALKELILLQMRDIRAETAPGLVKTLLWGDPGISMSLFGALPDAANWLMELLLELGRQLNGLPEPLLKDILVQVGKGIDPERLKQFPAVYAQLAGRLLFGDDATPEEKRAAVIAAVNSVLAGMDRITLELERNRKGVASSLARDVRALDTAALGRSLRRVLLLAADAARERGGKPAGRAPGVVFAVTAGAAGLIILRRVARKRKVR